MSSYLAVLAAAAQDRRTHYERAAVQTRAHFAAHPECRYVIAEMDAEGQIYRGYTMIDVAARCRPGWFSASLSHGGSAQGLRPVETLGCEEPICWQTKLGCAMNINLLMRLYLEVLVGGEGTKDSITRAG